MTYNLNIFSSLCSEYNTFDALSEYLRSEAGGRVSIIEDGDLAIFHYDKRITDMSRWAWMRSVVWDKAANRPVAIAPPKATEVDDTFMGTEGPLEGYQIQEYMEGTTLSIWTSGNDIRVASRTKFGASKGFYGAKTFREMLTDAVGDDLSSLIPLGETFVSVLLQHPEHRVVEEIKEARIFVLHAGHVEEDGTVVINENVDRSPSIVDGPEAGETIAAWFGRLTTAHSWTWQGICIKDRRGRRFRLRSNSYRMVRSLRGSTPRSDERFFALRAGGMVKTYLYYYPEDKKTYWRYETFVRNTTNAIYAEYCAVFKEKSKALEAVDAKLLTHVRALHAKYLAELRPSGRTVIRATAIQYVNSMPVPRLLYLLNVEKRERRGGVQALIDLASSSGHEEAMACNLGHEEAMACNLGHEEAMACNLGHEEATEMA
jgi:hypothetical protein